MQLFSTYIEKWLDALAQDVTSLPVGYDGLRLWLDTNRNEIDRIMAAPVGPNMFNQELYQLESSPIYGCITAGEIAEEFGISAFTLQHLMAPEWTDPDLCEARDMSLAFLYARQHYLPANLSLDAICKAHWGDIIGTHLDRLTDAGHPVDDALSRMMDQAVINLMLTQDATEEELGLNKESIANMNGQQFVAVIFSSMGTFAEFDAALRVELDLPPLSLECAKNESPTPA